MFSCVGILNMMLIIMKNILNSKYGDRISNIKIFSRKGNWSEEAFFVKKEKKILYYRHTLLVISFSRVCWNIL